MKWLDDLEKLIMKKGGEMDIKTQFKKLKDNWLIALIVLVLIFIAGSFNFNVPSTFDTFSAIGGASRDAMLNEKSVSTIMPPVDSGSFSPGVERILTQNAYLSAEVRRGQFQEADSKLKNIVKTTDSFLLDENVSQHDSQIRRYYSGTYSIRVETSKYDSVVDQLKGLGKVQELTKNIDDVTDSHTKLTIELSAEKDRLSRYEALYKSATSVEDKLSLSDRIYNQERTIKYYEDALTNIKDEVDYSSITVQLTEKHSDYAGVQFISLGALVSNVVTGINNLLTIIFFLLPYGLLAWLIYYGVRRLKKEKGRRK